MAATSPSKAVPVTNVRLSVADRLSSDAFLKGWLHKRGPSARFGWRKIWCILSDSEIVYFSDERCWEKKGDLPLRPCSKAIAFGDIRAPGDARSLVKDRPCGFVIDPGPPGRRRHLYYFDAITETLRTNWLTAVNRTVLISKTFIDSMLGRLYVRGVARSKSRHRESGVPRRRVTFQDEMIEGQMASVRVSTVGCQSGPTISNERKDQLGFNYAFVFVKPHAQTDAVRSLVSRTLQNRQIVILSQGRIAAEDIDEQRLIDKHYYAIASKATLLTPDKLPVPADRFRDKFGEEWATVLASGRAVNAMQATETFSLDPTALDAEWRKSEQAGLVVKFGGGFYCGKLAVGSKEFYVFNAFFMSMRSKFTTIGKSIYYYSVAWKVEHCSWKTFRSEVVGPTNPAEAPEGSIRRTIYDHWKSLGLAAQPDKGDNGVHGSASPFEGLAERMNWLDQKVGADPFGAVLLERGVDEECLVEWARDARISLGDGRVGSIFDELEDLNAEECCAVVVKLHSENRRTCRETVGQLVDRTRGDVAIEKGTRQVCDVRGIERASSDEEICSVKTLVRRSLLDAVQDGRLEAVFQRVHERDSVPKLSADNVRRMVRSSLIDAMRDGRLEAAFAGTSSPNADAKITALRKLARERLFGAHREGRLTALLAQTRQTSSGGHRNEKDSELFQHTMRNSILDAIADGRLEEAFRNARGVGPDSNAVCVDTVHMQEGAATRIQSRVRGSQSRRRVSSSSACEPTKIDDLENMMRLREQAKQTLLSSVADNSLEEALIGARERMRHEDEFEKLRIEALNVIVASVADGRLEAALQGEESVSPCSASIDKASFADADNNRAFLFVKPHAQTKAVRELVEQRLHAIGMTILQHGEVRSEDIASKQLIDKHYYALATKATLLRPEELAVPPWRFKDEFQEEWADVLASGRAKNAEQAAEAFGLDTEALEAVWKQTPVVKLGSGMYCGKMTVSEQTFYVFNAFYMAMRSKFLAPGTSIYFYSVLWPPNMCSWPEFRAMVVGTTDPAQAVKGSLRSAIFENWQSLGLMAPPNKCENAIHASASPFEAMVERMIWLGTQLPVDPFGALLLGGGMAEARITEWGRDVTVVRPEGECNVFDIVEDLDVMPCAAKLFELEEHALNVGERVEVKTFDVPGHIRFCGPPVHFAAGIWVGIELDKPVGKNDGTVKDVRYFECEPQCGIFVRPFSVIKLNKSIRDAAAVQIQCCCRRKAALRASQRMASTIGDLSYNRAFVFIKPHAQVEPVQKLVKQALRDANISIMKRGEIGSADIDARRLVDKHYYSIASKATLLQPADLAVPSDVFKTKFGEEWCDVLAAGKAANATQAAEAFGINAEGLESEWRKLDESKVVKFGGGFYCGKMEVGEKMLYVFNAFFLAMREKYTAPGKSIHYFVVKWDPADCPWSEFRECVVGSTDPAKAAVGSLRRAIYDGWQHLGLSAAPNAGDNGVHASASPFEALAERMNWLDSPLESDAFGTALLWQGGLGKQRLLEWSKDARVLLDAHREGSLFDALENLDAPLCYQHLVDIDALNGNTVVAEF
eukprot:TRINITY_DN32391_c0_g1_i1.p1 TRINITY_DN32391_c0_g1~~TRINITY_DN32391_c0_g1_i1.p1  ORF type:complete len:1575 (-),score=253.80 TRINITY_DN32391_c0_g1_i1:71-4729(-)